MPCSWVPSRAVGEAAAPLCSGKLFEWIEHSQSRSSEMPIVARNDGEPVPACRRGDVTVLERHPLPSFIDLALLLRPDVGDRHVEAVDPSVKRIDETGEPFLESFTLPSLIRANPVSELRDDDGARVTALLFGAEPTDHPRVTMALRRLAQYVGVQQPAHSLERKTSRRRRGRSSIGTGQSSSTATQFAFRDRRRKTMASSSASKSASNTSPGFAGARAVGTVSRRLASSVITMVG